MPLLPPAPTELDSRAAALLREAAARAGFNDRILSAFGIVGAAGWKATAHAALPGLPSAACGALARFFVIRDEMPQPALEAAFSGSDVLAALERAGLAAPTPAGLWQCPFVLIPSAAGLVLSDAIGDPASENPPDDYIMPVSGSSRFVDDLAVRDPCDLAVDLGCGQGYHALRSLSHARRCIATDINRRAVTFARVNASLNGAADRIECRQGSFFEPLQDVAGRVGLLTCNPPFIIQPGGHTTAAVSPTEGDEMIEHLVRTAPTMLAAGGWATVIGLWEHPDMADWVSRVRAWVEGSGCDALLLQFRTYRPEEYFQQWFSPEVRASAEPGWRALCERRRIGAITFGGLILRKRPGPNWVRAMFTLINVRTGPASDQLRAYFSTQTVLQAIASPAELLDRRLRIAPGWRFDPAQPPSRPASPGPRPGLALPLPNAAQQEQMLQAFDGNTTARQTVDFLHQWGRIPISATHPGTPGMLQALASSGALDIVE